MNPQENVHDRLKWKFKTRGDVESSPVIAQNGTIYVGSLDHYLYAINPNGSLKWKFRIGNYWRIPKYPSDIHTQLTDKNCNRTLNKRRANGQ